MKISCNDLEFIVLDENKLENIDFDCGDGDLNEFLLEDSIKNINLKLSVIYLCKYYGKIIGYVAISNDSIKIKKEDKVKIGIKYSHYPTIKIGRLAIDKKFQKKNIGSKIIEWVIGKGLILSLDVGIRFISVDAYIDSFKFYEKNEFIMLKKNKNKLTIPMYRDLKK